MGENHLVGDPRLAEAGACGVQILHFLLQRGKPTQGLPAPASGSVCRMEFELSLLPGTTRIIFSTSALTQQSSISRAES